MKPHNGGQWTEARKRQFIQTALRRATSRWGPKNECKKQARHERGIYRCAECDGLGPATLPPLPGRKRRRNNAAVDHVYPVVAPNVGFTNWDEHIERLFCELEGFQVLCWECHERKTAEERSIRTERMRREKDELSSTDGE